MMAFIYFLKGYYKIVIKGSAKERFLNLCTNKNILIWNLKRHEDEYEFYVSRKAFQTLNDMKEKTNITLTIKGEYGLPFFLYLHKKRKFFFLGIIWCIFLIYVLSLFVWDIQIIGTEKYTEDEIKKYLTEKEIHVGVVKKKISCSSLEESIREDFPDTAWVSCDLEGTCLSVHVKESIDLSDIKKNTNDVPNDIIAAKDGTIVSMITRDGTPMVKKGDEVKKGDTLISGVIYLYNEYDELLETSLLNADGDIYAKTVYNYEEEFPLVYYEKEYTGDMLKQYKLYLGDYEISLPSKGISFKNYDKISENHPLKIGKSFYLPLSMQVTSCLSYQSKQVTLSEKEAKEKAYEKIDYYLNQFIQEEKEVENKEFHVVVKEDICIIKGSVSVIESIGKIRNIP